MSDQKSEQSPPEYYLQLREEARPLMKKMLSCVPDGAGGPAAMLACLEASIGLLENARDSMVSDDKTLFQGWLNLALFSVMRFTNNKTVLNGLQMFLSGQQKDIWPKKGLN